MAKQRRGLPKVKGDIDAPDLGQELGVPNLMPGTSWTAWNPSIPAGVSGVGKDPLSPDLNELIFMLRRDGQAQAMLNLLTLPIRAAFAKSKWVVPEAGGGQQETDFANLMWTLPSNSGGMQTSRSMFLKQALLALPHGLAPFEIVKDYREDGPLAGKYVIDKLAYRDPRTVTMLADDHGNFQGFQQRATLGTRIVNEVILKENAWYFAANEEHNPLYGVSYFEPAFQHYQSKRKMYYLGEIAAQMGAVPGRVGTLAPGASPKQIRKFITDLQNMHFNQSMVKPPGFELDSFNSNSNFDFLKIIDHHNTMMVTSILAGFLQQDDRTILVDNGQADASADMFIQLLEAITFELSESWTTKLMPQFIDYNFGTGVYPVHQFAPLTDDNKNAIFELFGAIAGLQTLNVTPEFVRSLEMSEAERFGFKIDYNQIADEEEQAAKDMAQQAAQEAAAQQQAIQTPPVPGVPQPQGQNKQQRGLPSPAPTGAGGRPPNGLPHPTVKASATQEAAINMITAGLSALVSPDDVPDDFLPEGIVIPEMQEELPLTALSRPPIKGAY